MPSDSRWKSDHPPLIERPRPVAKSSLSPEACDSARTAMTVRPAVNRRVDVIRALDTCRRLRFKRVGFASLHPLHFTQEDRA